jgi:hypothetical protein
MPKCTSHPSGCGPYAIAMAANLFNTSYKSTNYKGADVETFLQNTGSKIPGVGLDTWINFGAALQYYAHGWVEYKSNASLEDLELAIENEELGTVQKI